jgi:hypothetical protein
MEPTRVPAISAERKPRGGRKWVLFGLIVLGLGVASQLGACAGPANCEAAPSALAAAISSGLLGGTHLSGARMVRHPDRQDVWLIAAEIDGPGIDGPGEIGVWATTDPSGSGSIFSISAFADEFSDWGHMPGPASSEAEFGASCL